MPDEPMFLLTDLETVEAYFRAENTPTLPSMAIRQAQLRKVVAYIMRHSVRLPLGLKEPETINLIERHILYLGAEEWTALMREAGITEPQVEAK